MKQKQRGEKAKAQEPEYTWGEAPGGQPEVLWEHSARPLWAQVVAERDGVLLMEKERLVFRRVSTGKVLWEDAARDLPDELASDGEGLLFAWGNHLEARDLESGKVRWRQRPGGPITGMALAPDMVFASTKGPLFALNRADGRQRWRATCAWEPELGFYGEAGLLVVDDPETETIRALNAETGTPLWDYSAQGQPVVAGPLAAGALLVSGHAAGLAAVDVASGEVRWQLATDRAFETPAVVAGETIIATDGIIHALEAETGAVLWERKLEDEEDGVFTLRLHHGTLYAETWRGRLLALNPQDGALRWECRPGQVHSLTGDAQTLYLRIHLTEPVGRWGVAALRQDTGELLWELHARRMVPDITLVGGVLAVELKTQVLALAVGS